MSHHARHHNSNQKALKISTGMLLAQVLLFLDDGRGNPGEKEQLNLLMVGEAWI
jgi:hypothetical protein